MDTDTLDTLKSIGVEIFKEDWRESLEALFINLRKMFVFDNLAIYLADSRGNSPDPVKQTHPGARR